MQIQPFLLPNFKLSGLFFDLMSVSNSIQIIICHNRTCRKQGAAKVLQAFQAANFSVGVITPSGCLGSCGNGPMVLVLPEQVWYDHVTPEQVPSILGSIDS
ncbi:hypothetical protein SPLC1_S270940 [Arthrospira platensis C1]|uniref:Ferredoxin, 2Fe-2S n=2 Tax=Limnospira TaxID=2596745 RepID=A0A9P1KIS0_9CYAN|nr:(2Fe-2S) ferredoxin domain-containing protein [Limnospira sp. PMC 1234.20]EKD08172.1 hypothetical protein SPLC1_S270940 [Arthrospira platensis C1]MDT9227485.1 (2Fe-2S) ferredoxin domain-containing protein [Limnospira sp. PMC 1242.20]MDT9273964.1 (2Fe-2S) ferredoxin domain-containing protein [Limnospira sp. PMC 737.11]CDM97059.1 conserved hypothetical protein [Limnospira indica PCC 8005]